ncbi:MAG: prepilin-type N-terminal cleavage/methylation domain-containing protein [Veillonellales bacterium]
MQKEQQGFLMLEVVVATVIISLALVAAAGMFIQSTRANSSAADYTVAANLAQKQLELLKNKDVSYWTIHANDPNIPWQDTGETLPLTINRISYTITTQSTVSPENSYLVQVVVTVSRTDPGNSSQQTVQMTSFYPLI